ncbi:hypothetical protein ACFU8Q_01110 [Streptomyces sp. NPDC057543]|uniref:hypothetical protein n=1 Tax=Streptomyces sp. NPDC057543 TaxID=3346163 RepID=UPI0036C230BF
MPSPRIRPARGGGDARCQGRGDGTGLRHRLLTLLETANAPRRLRYAQLLAVINVWPPPNDPAPALAWFAEALRARAARHV